jgi:NADPH:quinone reductase-like Zn-dependent oxidoreductase
MKAIVYTQYGSADVLQFKEVERPAPREDEVLIKVHAASLNAADWHYLRGTPFLFRLDTGLPKPQNRFLGADRAGRVETVDRNVTQLPGALGSTSVHRYGCRQKITGCEYRNG